jgi:hypothetical protein
MADLSCAIVGAEKGILPISMKYNKIPNAQTSTGQPK